MKIFFQLMQPKRRHFVKALLLFLWFSPIAVPVKAHEVMPASLMINEQSPNHFVVRWRIPQTQGIPLNISPIFPSDCSKKSHPINIPSALSQLQQWDIYCQNGLTQGDQIHFHGLELTLINVIIRLERVDGHQETLLASAREPNVTFGAVDTSSSPLPTSAYFSLGVHHILSGLDHLLFVLCLMLLVPKKKALIKTITAFTLAHSITLALASLSIITVPQAPIEATIALSILYLARELALKNRGLSWQQPWVVAFAFGLLHGFGFAGALAEVGLPSGDIPTALFLFNVGVEAGQLIFVVAVLAAISILRYVLLKIPAQISQSPSTFFSRVTFVLLHPNLAIYAIGSVSAYWLIERLMPIF